jgi:small subunit ribosomal protein S17
MSEVNAGNQGTAEPAEVRGHRKLREGVVVSSGMDKTVVVAQKRRVPHPLYKRYITLTKKYHVHDEKNECSVGDRVRIMETRPISKTKRWRLVSVLEKVR